MQNVSGVLTVAPVTLLIRASHCGMNVLIDTSENCPYVDNSPILQCVIQGSSSYHCKNPRFGLRLADVLSEDNCVNDGEQHKKRRIVT